MIHSAFLLSMTIMVGGFRLKRGRHKYAVVAGRKASDHEEADEDEA